MSHNKKTQYNGVIGKQISEARSQGQYVRAKTFSRLPSLKQEARKTKQEIRKEYM